jgi:hypothetical protein
MLALNHLRADTERLDVRRSSTGIEVKGVVETEERKLQLTAMLNAFPHVASRILSYRDMERSRTPSVEPTTVEAMAVVSSESPIDAYCQGRHLDRETCRRISYQLLSAATDISRKSSQISDLLARFAPDPSLTPEAAAILDKLLHADIADVDAATIAQERVLATLDVSIPLGSAVAAGDPKSLASIAQQNLKLSTDLVYARNELSTPPEQGLAELARSLMLIQESVTHLPEVFPTGTTSARSQAPQPK